MPFFKGWLSFSMLCDKIKELLTATEDWVHVVTLDDRMALRHVPSNRFLTLQRKIVGNCPGVQFILSSAFNLDNHSPSGTIKAVFAPIYYHSNSTRANEFFNLYVNNPSVYQFPVTLWADRRGFLFAIQNPYTYSDGVSFGVFVNVEYIPLVHREYNDGLEGFFMLVIRNDQATGTTTNGGLGTIHYFARDLAIESQYKHWEAHERGAIKSWGSGIGYFEFPTYYNDIERRTVSAITKRWFFADGVSLPDNYVIRWQDRQVTRKFIVVRVQATNPTVGFNVAIPYSNAYDYPV